MQDLDEKVVQLKQQTIWWIAFMKIELFESIDSEETIGVNQEWKWFCQL